VDHRKVYIYPPTNSLNTLPESKWDLYKFLDAQLEAIERAGSGFKSNRIRKFIRDFCARHQIWQVPWYSMYIEFRDAYPDIPIKETYFRNVCEKTWKTFTNDNDLIFLDVSKELKQIKYRRKF
jgi:hypothetical protein